MFLSTIASAGDYVTVTGSGKTFEEAKQQAFRKAIEFKVGATILSDVETKNFQRVKDDIYVYSAGYVDDYKILTQENNYNGVVVLLDVSVNESKIKNRILAQGKSEKEFQGELHNTQLSTYLTERAQGDRILQKVLDNYPNKAYHIRQSNYNIKLDYSRNPILNVPYELWWNFDFVQSLREATGLIGNCKPEWKKPCAAVINIMAKDPKDWVLGSSTEHYFYDLNTITQIHNRLVEHSPRIVLKYYDISENYLFGTCHTPKFIWGGSEGFYSNGKTNQIIIYGNVKEKGIIQTSVPLAILDKISKIELTVESKNICLK